MTQSDLRRCIITITLIALAISTAPARLHAAAGGPFSDANSRVNSAFASIYYAAQNGGDVSSLVEELNVAILLIHKADAENVTNPKVATADLSNATTLAQMVSLTSASVSSSGSMARQLRLYESLETIVTMLGVATLVYLEGDRVYRRLWLFVYKNHLVKKADE